MSNKFTSKYHTIVTDKKSNSPNKSMQKKLSVEEYYDLMHHTHKMSDIINGTDDDLLNNDELIKTVNELKMIVNEQQNEINELKETMKSLNNETLNVMDWDLDTEENQDINGV